MGKNARKSYIINPSYQYKQALFVCLCLLPLSAIYPIVILNIFDFFLAQVHLDSGQVLNPEIANFKSGVIGRLLILQIIFLTLVALISLYLSHRTAGPLYKLSKAMRDLKEGKLDYKLGFRKGDYYMELADEFNEMVDQVAGFKNSREVSRVKSSIEKLQQIQTKVDTSQQKELNAVIEQLQDSIK